MARSLKDFDANVRAVEEHYDGRILLAEDLACFPLD